MWQKLKTICGGSLTVFVSYVFMGLGVFLQNSEDVLSFITDQDIPSFLASYLGADPKIMAKYFMAVSVITFIARRRELIKKVIDGMAPKSGT